MRPSSTSHWRDDEQTREILALEKHLKATAVVDERNRLAREMHDGIGAALSGLIIQAEYLKSMLDEPETKQEAEELYELAQTAIEELRRSLKMMRADFELVPALLEHCSDAASRYRINVDPELMEPPPGIPSEQQASPSSGCCRSASPTPSSTDRRTGSRCRLTFRTNKLVLEVEDNGKGFDPTLGKLRLLRADQHARARHPLGWRLHARVGAWLGLPGDLLCALHAARDRGA